MKTKFCNVIVVCIAILLSIQLTAQEKYSQVKVYPPEDPRKFGELMGLLEIDHFMPAADGSIVSEISQSAIKKLKIQKYKFEILSEDPYKELAILNEQYEEKRKKGILPKEPRMARLAFEQQGSSIDQIIATPSSFQVKTGNNGYYTYAEMIQAIDDLVAAYPTLAQKINLTPTASQRTVGNREIWAIKISDNVGDDALNEPEVLFIGLQHAREAIGGASMVFFMQYLCENYATDPRVKELVDNRQVYIIPCMNPDGWEFNLGRIAANQTPSWRKNRRPFTSGSTTNYGVDLNRNWGVDWGNCAGATSSCGSGASSAETYYGPSVFSEKETQAVRDFTYARRFVAMIDQHAYGPYYSLPFGRPSLHTMDVHDANFFTYVPAAMGYYNGMRAGNSPQAVNYEVAGGVKDWMLMGNIGTGTKGKIYGMTGEGGAGGGTPSYGSVASFWPPKEEIINLCKGMVFQNLQLLLSAGTYIDLQDKSDIVVGSKNGSFTFDATRVGLGNDPVTVSLIPIKNIQTVGDPVTISPANLANYYSVHSASINYTLHSALTNGQELKYAWRIEAAGITYSDTVTKIYHATPAAVILAEDNMNSGSFSTNWTRTGSTWGYTSNGTGYGGTGRAMSESPSGNYSGGSDILARWNGTFNLSTATAAYLSFWVKHRAENFRDKLQLQVSRNSTDGSNGDWMPIAGSHTVQEPGILDGSTINGQPALTGIRDLWTRVTYDFKDYIGIGNSNVRFRFVFTSDPANSSTFAFRQDDGFMIDEVKFVRSTAQLVTLPVEFLNFIGTLTPDRKVDLKWEAVVDEKHSYFEVERSADGQNFIALAKVSHPFSYIDQSPEEGTNYYRIKQYDFDGKFSYSKTISVYLSPLSFGIHIYPNPVNDEMSIRIKTPSPEKLTIQLTDLAGKLVLTRNAVVSNGNIIKFDISHLPNQVYVLKLIDKSAVVVATEKIIKKK